MISRQSLPYFVNNNTERSGAMKIVKGLVTVAMVASLATSSFAAPISTSLSKQSEIVIQQEETVQCRQQDPLKALEQKKAKIRELEKSGKLSPAEAEKKIAKLDEKIKKIEEFNALPL